MGRASGAGGPPEFLTRERELGRLLALFEEAAASSMRCAVVTGEPGIGKTRLVAELCSRVGDAAACHWVRCYEGQPPLWCWTQLLRDMGVGQDLSQRLQTTHADTVRTARFDTLTALSRAVASAAKGEARVLVLDDVHVADEASLEALAFIGRETPQQPPSRNRDLPRHRGAARPPSRAYPRRAYAGTADGAHHAHRPGGTADRLWSKREDGRFEIDLAEF